MFTIEEQFKNWMLAQINQRGQLFSKNTATAYAYSLNTSLPLFNFNNYKQKSVFEITDAEICEKLFNKCLHHPNFREINMKNDNGAFNNAMKLYIRFLQEDNFIHNNASNIKNTIKSPQTSKNNIQLLIPTPELIIKYNEKWSKLDKYPEQEDILTDLFSDENNSNFKIVLTKTIFLNEFYSTHLDNVVGMAKHIVNLGINEKLNNNDISLVEDIAFTPSEMNNAYSFASKYCSWHKPYIYPILDSYAKGVLYKMNKEFKFMPQFTRQNISSSYTFYCNIYKNFIQHFNLQDFTLKQIDRFLWLFGKENEIKI
ncbi:MAG: hypothetical protein NC213_00195 [Acetobacter sp.]|nr:hypothetical protein [Bacteroides sp.]MCM1340145.1 hypothetical protein [Acetobacter sp.]MCM1432727.1 hypothetical protein [Clostridiales bacterium]